MMPIDWQQIIASGELVIGTAAEAQNKAVFPNRLGWVAGRQDVGALIGFQNGGEDVAIGKAGVDYISAAIAGGRIAEGYVLLLRRTDSGNELIRAIPVAELTAGHVSWRAGRWGQYTWVNATMAADFGVAPF
jgi:hypothetical protein